jgi:hypothetical protein
MWEPRPLTPLWAFTACYRDSFTFYLRLVLPSSFILCTFYSWVGMRPDPLGRSATSGPIVPDSDVGDDEGGSICGMRIGKGNNSTFMT